MAQNVEPRGLGWTAQSTIPGPNPVTNTSTLSWAASTGFTAGQVITLAGGDMHLCTTAGTSGGSAPTWATIQARNDVGTTTAGSNVVLDSAITSADLGRVVIGTGIPGGTYVGTVTAGVSFLLSNVAGSQAGSVVAPNTGQVQLILENPRTVDNTAVWTLIDQKIGAGYNQRTQDYVNSPPTRQDLTVAQKPAP